MWSLFEQTDDGFTFKSGQTTAHVTGSVEVAELPLEVWPDVHGQFHNFLGSIQARVGELVAAGIVHARV